MSSFHEIRFPTDISLGASGGPMRRTQVVSLGSGHEERNQQWAGSKRTFNAGYGVKTADDLHAIIAFFEERRGRFHGFRWRDWSDWKSCPPLQTPAASDQVIGTGDGATTVFQLVKTYGGAFAPWVRTIAKPVNGTVRVAVNGIEKTATTDFTVDSTSGLVTFTGGSIPASGEVVTVGFEFDVPVRFDTDRLVINVEHFRAGALPDIPIVEMRL
jgi:uncharacterized protein (TIGR02217 family)